MILSTLRLLRSLSLHHYRAIIVTILLPVIWPPMIAPILDPTASFCRSFSM